jgi:hypothetical protein
MDRDEFRAMLDRDRPSVLDADLVQAVHPPPWVTWHGSGTRAHARLKVGDHRYEHRPGDDVWTRVDEPA